MAAVPKSGREISEPENVLTLQLEGQPIITPHFPAFNSPISQPSNIHIILLKRC